MQIETDRKLLNQARIIWPFNKQELQNLVLFAQLT
jgi:hypothetical protein